MNTLKGPAIFLAQFAGEKHPYNIMKSIAEWSISLGFEGIQIPSWESKLFNLDQAAESKDYFADSGQTYSFGEELKVGISSVKDLLFNEKEQLIPT